MKKKSVDRRDELSANEIKSAITVQREYTELVSVLSSKFMEKYGPLYGGDFVLSCIASVHTTFIVNLLGGLGVDSAAKDLFDYVNSKLNCIEENLQ